MEVLNTGAGVTLRAPRPCEKQSSRSCLFFTSHLSQTPKCSASFSSCSKLSPKAKSSKKATNSISTSLFYKGRKSKRTMQLLWSHLGDFITSEQQNSEASEFTLHFHSHPVQRQRTKWRGHGVSCNKTEPESSDTHFFTTALKQFQVPQNSSSDANTTRHASQSTQTCFRDFGQNQTCSCQVMQQKNSYASLCAVKTPHGTNWALQVNFSQDSVLVCQGHITDPALAKGAQIRLAERTAAEVTSHPAAPTQIDVRPSDACPIRTSFLFFFVPSLCQCPCLFLTTSTVS